MERTEASDLSSEEMDLKQAGVEAVEHAVQEEEEES